MIENVLSRCSNIGEELVHQELALVHQTDCAGVTNLKLVTTNPGRRFRGSSLIDHSLPVGGSAQTAVKTLSGWRRRPASKSLTRLMLEVNPLCSALKTCSPTQLPVLSYAIVPEAKGGFQNNC
ncbi:hypothetical protein ACFQHW_05455 [Lapidilactobacillus achengensis]|uniref:Uncharacterized protein n=1 Tax=Lapidilactobacillus achengensis TaxID=2486000 RepID=A0ABW1UPU8_9LACO|nr:hypothetical protein [Lapidilactobacillus achengensis]